MRTLAQRFAAQTHILARLATVKGIDDAETKKRQALSIIGWLSEQHLPAGMELHLEASLTGNLHVRRVGQPAPVFVVSPTFLDAGVSTTQHGGVGTMEEGADRDAVHRAMRTMVADGIPLGVAMPD